MKFYYDIKRDIRDIRGNSKIYLDLRRPKDVHMLPKISKLRIPKWVSTEKELEDSNQEEEIRIRPILTTPFLVGSIKIYGKDYELYSESNWKNLKQWLRRVRSSVTLTMFKLPRECFMELFDWCSHWDKITFEKWHIDMPNVIEIEFSSPPKIRKLSFHSVMIVRNGFSSQMSWVEYGKLIEGFNNSKLRDSLKEISLENWAFSETKERKWRQRLGMKELTVNLSNFLVKQ